MKYIRLWYKFKVSEEDSFCEISSSFDFSIDYNRISTVVIGNIEWFVNLFTVIYDLFFCLLEWVSDEIVRLHWADWEVYMILGNLKWIKRHIFRFVGQAILEFSHTWKDTGAISLQSSLLLAHSEFNGEPVNCSKSCQLSFTCTKRSKANFLWEVREILMREHRSVA
jgi:hypothetical protein